MSLPVPLTVSVGDDHLTHRVEGLTFRKEAVGGVQNITLSLSAPLSSTRSAMQKVRVMDARSATVIAEGRVTDTGRTADESGQRWSMTAFGPAAHANDMILPLIYVDTRLDTFTRDGANSTKRAQTGNDERATDEQTLLVSAKDGATVATSWSGAFISRVMQHAGLKLARVRATVDCGVTDANYTVRLRTRLDDSAGTSAASTTASTSNQQLDATVVTNFSNGHNQLSLQVDRTTSSKTAGEDDWFEFWNIIQRCLLLDASGAEITTGYTQGYVLAHEVVKDLLGRVLDQYDGAGATVDSSGTHQIDQMAYPDGVTAGEVLADLMALEPAFRWTTGPDTTGNGYPFSWEPWPTTVRYEAPPEDTVDFPTSTQELYNEVDVRWVDKRGRSRSRLVTGACPTLDDEGLTRRAQIDVADELGSVANADRIGARFLAEHKYPPNMGTINVARPIRDLETGRLVQPFEIEPGELIRVRGVESYPDALNATSNDGLTVFRIWAMTYTADANVAQLELDAYPRTIDQALAKLERRRDRKR